jgi:hypothetical protein
MNNSELFLKRMIPYYICGMIQYYLSEIIPYDTTPNE